MKRRVKVMMCGLAVLLGCAEEPPPPSVQDYINDPNALEAAMVRCSFNRTETRYSAECVNARQAVSLIEAKQERARRAAFEAQSEAKRAALRRTQQAAAEARRRAEEAERRRREAEYLAQFGELPPREDSAAGDEVPMQNAPGAVLPTPEPEPSLPEPHEEPPPVGSNAPGMETSPSDLDAVREELRRRNESAGN